MLTLDDFMPCPCQIALRHPVRDEMIVLRAELGRQGWQVTQLTYLLDTAVDVDVHRTAAMVNASTTTRRARLLARSLRAQGWRTYAPATDYRWITCRS